MVRRTGIPTKRTRDGKQQVWQEGLHGGRWVTQYPERRQTRERCHTCHDTGQVVTGIADPDDPWSANTYKDCPRGCERSES